MAFEGARIAAVVPAYNEEKMITTVIETMPGGASYARWTKP